MKWSPRLQLLADLIEQAIPTLPPAGAVVADIGTDHGYLPMYLMEHAIAAHVILCDVNEGPLQKARANLERAGRDPATWDIRKGDGLQPLQSGEAGTVVIAGMGGLLIRDILTASPEKTEKTDLFLLQPRSECGALRGWLWENGWQIREDRLVRESSFLCQVLAVSPPAGGRANRASRQTASETELLCAALDWEVSPRWFDGTEPLLTEFLERMTVQETAVWNGLQKSTAAGADEKREAVRKRLEKLCTLQTFHHCKSNTR